MTRKVLMPMNRDGSHWYECRGPSSILLLCGIFLMYVVVSTLSFLSWDLDPQGTSKKYELIGSKQEDYPRRHSLPLSHAFRGFGANEEFVQRKTALHRVDNHQHGGQSDITSTAPAFFDTNSSAYFASHRYSDTETAAYVAPSFSIFYNVYIPTDQGRDGSDRALSIVEEQINQIGKSYATSFEHPVQLYYNTIGMPGVVTDVYMRNLCVPNHIECIHMQHYQSGFEEFTLQRLHEYCHAQPHNGDDTSDHQQQQGQQHRVVYMHNKGSYHDWGGENARWRSHLTQAVTTRDCLQPNNITCSVCGLIFFGAWALIFPGNFWVADCAYIRRLPPPPTFFAQMDEVFRKRQDKIAENPLYSIAFPDVEGIDDHGAGRYSQEHWIGSHPSLQPCDLTSDPLTSWRQRMRSSVEFSWSMFPRPAQTNDPTTDWDRPPLIAGNLFKWFTLYGHAPADDSWVWRWFPYGEKYKQAVKLYGNRTFDVMVTKEIARFRTLFGRESENPTAPFID